jgi:hypothetical protein
MLSRKGLHEILPLDTLKHFIGVSEAVELCRIIQLVSNAADRP